MHTQRSFAERGAAFKTRNPKKESEEEKSVGKRKSRQGVRPGNRKREKLWKSAKFLFYSYRKYNLLMYIFSSFGNMHCFEKQLAAYINY